MTKKKKSTRPIPNTEILIVLVLVFSFIALAVMRCNDTKKSYEETDATASTVQTEEKPTVEATPPSPSPSPNKTTQNTNTIAETPLVVQSTPPTPPPSVVSRLYVTLEDLNLRTGPHLDSTILTKLKLFDEVFFMNEVTDFNQKISLGPEIADEPWIKVRSRKGHVGWVYGAGVNYYKKKRLSPPVAIPEPSVNNVEQ